jgi:hypothetical protein
MNAQAFLKSSIVAGLIVAASCAFADAATDIACSTTRCNAAAPTTGAMRAVPADARRVRGWFDSTGAAMLRQPVAPRHPEMPITFLTIG